MSTPITAREVVSDAVFAFIAASLFIAAGLEG